MTSIDGGIDRLGLLPHPLTEQEEVENGVMIFDGLNLYRALARQHTGDPSNHLNVVNAVLDYYLRIWANPIHPDRQQIYELDHLDCGRLKTFFNALNCPDDIDPNLYDRVVEFIADALNVHITTWEVGEGGLRAVSDLGKSFVPTYHVLRSVRTISYAEEVEDAQDSEYGFYFHSLLHNESGTPLLNYLEAQEQAMDREGRGETQTIRYSGLQLKKVCWWWRTNENGDAFQQRDDGAYDTEDSGSFVCRSYNEYKENPPQAPRLDDMRDSLSVFTVSVSSPNQIQPALRLLNEALEIAPAQEIPVNPQVPIGVGGKRSLRRYVAIDAEFALKSGEIGDALGDRWELGSSNPENLCSVLTVAVDRHLVFSFYLLHMLENPTEQTVPQLSVLFKKLLFENDYLKVWWNYGEDFAVLDATIAHMFQGTPRPRHMTTPYRGAPYLVQPFFKIKSAYYQGVRPQDLTFSRESVACTFHVRGENELGIACPCSLGNVDLSTILDHICRQLGLTNAAYATSTGVGQRQWWKAKKFNNYAKLLDWLLSQDRVYPLLNYLKEGAARSGDKDSFYQSLGPGMETDINKMGYNIGDVVGIALIMRYLTTTDDRLLLAARLYNYASMHAYCHATPAMPQRLVGENRTGLTFPQIEDNPRLWRRARLTNDMAMTSGYQTLAVNTAWNTYVRHEEVADCVRKRWSETTPYPENDMRWVNTVRDAYLDIFDPTEYSLPEHLFTLDVPPNHEDCASKRAIVRTGKAHDDDFLDFIRSRRSRKTLPPRGFLAGPDSDLSLPHRYNRRAGQSLTKHMEIAAAFKTRNELKPGETLPRRQGTPGYIRKPRQTINRSTEAWDKPAQAIGAWDDESRVRKEAAYRDAEIDRINFEEGPPAEYRPDLIFDADGRQHNLNIMKPGILKSQVYSPWDVARPSDAGPLTDNVLQRLRVLVNTKEWNPDEEDVDLGRHQGPSIRPVQSGRGGRGRGYQGRHQVVVPLRPMGKQASKQAPKQAPRQGQSSGSESRGAGQPGQRAEGNQGRPQIVVPLQPVGKWAPKQAPKQALKQVPKQGQSSSLGGRAGGQQGQQGQASGPRGQSGPIQGRRRGGDGDRGGSVADLAQNLTHTRLKNSFAAWKKETLGKRVRFGDVQDGEQGERQGDSRMTKRVKVS